MDLMLTRLTLFTLIFSLLLAGCAPKAEFDIRGDWNYTLIAADGSVYDTGAITFSGKDAAAGTYVEINIYQVEYKGEFTMKGKDLQLTGDEPWKCTVMDANNFSGTWKHNDGVSGTLIAIRKKGVL
jgi:hypothetical protein